ncbi:MAG: GAF domain-containing protein [Acidobacteriota bacterium]|nr:MAG: GAF domain-containing protein [Acidobacteriota bacterium]
MVPLGDPVLIPIESELRERVHWFIRLRWMAVVGILLGGWLVSSFVFPEVSPIPFWSVGLVVFLYNIFFHRIRFRIQAEPRSLKRTVFLQIGLDWFALLVLIFYSGGIWSPIALAFNFHLIIGAILLSKRTCFLLAGIASAALLLSVCLDDFASGLAPPSALSPHSAFADSISGLYVWFALTAILFVTAFLVTSITAQLREKEEALSSSERALSHAYREMEALHQLGQTVNSTLDMNEVLGLIAEHATKLLEMKACFIRLFDDSGKYLFIGGSYGLSQAYIDKGPVEVSKSLIDSETLRGGVVQVLNVTEDRRFQYREEARAEGLASVLCVPVSAKSRVLGVIRVYSAEPHQFSEQEQHLLMNLANLGAVAIQNARTYANLKALNEQRVWFARMTHHQLRSPLAAISATLDAVPYAGDLSEKQRELIHRARRRIEDAFETIRDLLDLAAAQRPPEDRRVKPTAIAPVLQKVVDAFQERARGKNVEFNVTLPPENVTVNVEAADLERIFSNLLDNAIKYTPSGGRVALECRFEQGQCLGEVRDTGVGIAADEIERVFDGFFRGQAAKATGEMGTGLGLSIVRQLIDRLGGKLNLESTPGVGTTVSISLKAQQAGPS